MFKDKWKQIEKLTGQVNTLFSETRKNNKKQEEEFLDFKGYVAKYAEEINEEIKKLKESDENRIKDVVVCETCGCLVKKDKATKVQEMVDKEETHYFGEWAFYLNKTQQPDKEIKTYYLCQHCKNKSNEKTNKIKPSKKSR